MTAPAKREAQATLPCTQQRTLTDKLGKYIARDAKLVARMGWEAFINGRRGRGDLTNLEKVHHPARRLR